MIFIVGASLAFFLEFILISKKGKSLADKILTVWMFVMGTHLLLHFFEYNGLDQQYHFLLGLNSPFPLLHGPFLFLYAKAAGATELNTGDCWFKVSDEDR